MIISTNTYNRDKLNEDQKEFFVKVFPLAQLISNWTLNKADFNRIDSPRGMLASLVAAEILLKSNFGEEPISKSDYNNKYSNNLSLLVAGKYWVGKSQTYEGIKYKSFKDWFEFATEFSDEICFSDEYTGLLNSYRLIDQVKFLSLTNSDPHCYNNKLMSIINSYGLEELDGL